MSSTELFIQSALEIPTAHKSHQDHDHGSDGDRQEHSEETEELSTRKDREDHGDGMKADFVANQIGNKHPILDELPDTKDSPYPKEGEPFLKLKNCRDGGDDDPNGETKVGDEAA